MRIYRLILAFFLLAFSAGCNLEIVTLLLLPLPGPHIRTISETGDFEHASSKMVFPKEIEGFKRVEITQYDTQGYNVTVDYKAIDPEEDLISSVHIYPASEMSDIGATENTTNVENERYLDQEIKKIKYVIERDHPDWKLIDSNDSRLHNSYIGKKVTYNFQELYNPPTIDLVSSVHVYYVEKKWYVKFTFTYPAMNAEVCEQKIKNLVDSLQWP